MKRFLIVEVAVLLLLVVVAICVRVGTNKTPQPTQKPTLETTQVTGAPTDPPATQVMAPTAPEPTATEAPPPTAPADWNITARQYMVFDCENESYLALSDSGNEKVYPASITKLFSAFVALQYLDPETEITAGDEVSLIAEDSSIAFISKGHRLTAAMLVEGMLLPSGNDASYILATAAARKASGNQNMPAAQAIAYFVDLMNTAAKDLGMTGTHFSNPDGYHADDHYTTCRDLTVIARLALGDATIRKYVSLPVDSVVYASGQTNTWYNTNALISSDSNYYCPDAIGLKTGFTDEAGNCLLSAFRRDGRTVIIGVFGCPEKSGRFTDTLTLYENLVQNSDSE